MKRRLQINLIKLFAAITLAGALILITQKNYLPINKESFHLRNKKNQLLQILNAEKDQAYFYKTVLPKYQNYKNMGIFLEPTHDSFKHQLRHILDDYNITATVRFHDTFYDKIFPDFDISYFPVSIQFVVYDTETIHKLINDINHRMSYLISPIQLNFTKNKDKYYVDYKVLWIKGFPSGELSNLSAVESPWHFSES